MATKGKLRGQEGELIRLYQEGLSLQTVAEGLGVTLKAVQYWLKKRGVARRSLSQAIASSWTPDRKQGQRQRFDPRKIQPGHGYKLARRKHCPSIRGERNPMWKGGVTPAHRLIRTSAEYKQWREAVFTRDNWACVLCGARCSRGRKVILHADHIQPFAEFPDLRFVVSNGRTLCRECHKKTPTYGVNRRTRKCV